MPADDHWRKRAECREYEPDLFFPTPTDLPGQDYAKAICAACPVTDRCRTERVRVRADHGVWAGQYHHPTTDQETRNP